MFVYWLHRKANLSIADWRLPIADLTIGNGQLAIGNVLLALLE
jgi:hypothetical protein